VALSLGSPKGAFSSLSLGEARGRSGSSGESPAGDADGAEVAHYFLISWLLATSFISFMG